MTPASLAAWRKLLGLTQERLATLLGTSQVTMARWESYDPITNRGMAMAHPAMIHRAMQQIEREMAEVGTALEPAGPFAWTTRPDGIQAPRVALPCPQCDVTTAHDMDSALAGDTARWTCSVCGMKRWTAWRSEAERAAAGRSQAPPLPELPRRTRGRLAGRREERPKDIRRRERRQPLQDAYTAQQPAAE